MKKMLCNIAVIAACTLLLSQCASQDQVTIMQNQLRGLYIKLKEQEETITRLKKEAAMEQLSSVSVIDQVKDESLQHREQMQEDMRRLQTEVDRLERSFGSVSAENQQEVTNLSTRVADLNKELDEERRKAQQMEAEQRKAQLVAAERRVQAAAEKEKEAKKRLDAIATNQSSLKLPAKFHHSRSCSSDTKYYEKKSKRFSHQRGNKRSGSCHVNAHSS